MLQRFLLVFLFIVVPVSFSVAADEVFNLAGAGAVVSTSPYDGVHAKTMAVPFLIGEYKDLYVKGLEAGYHFLKARPLTLSLITRPRLMGYASSDSASFDGMENRCISLDAGLKAEYRLPWYNLIATAKVLTDTLSRHQGSEYQVALGRMIRRDIYQIIPSVGVRYEDSNLINYYYGVEDGEARAGRPAYAPRGTVNSFADVAFTCGIARRLIVIMLLDVESLGRDIRKSPIVDKNYVFSAAAGLTYRF